ncbi:MAG: beta-propeller domain-containing protein [Litorimonas sp.]
MTHWNKHLVLIGVSLTLSACATRPLMHVADDPRYDALKSETLGPFSSETDFKSWLRQAKRLERKRRKALHDLFDNEHDIVVVTGSRQSSSGPNITNVQNRGVDEGDIVKLVGDHLVFMQDGRLFSLNIAGAAPTLTARVDIYSEINEDIWYDELLVSDRRLVVTGYHYGKNATEITVFDLDIDGQFSRHGTWYLESEDYYSSDNSATRMIGDTLIFHTQGDVEEPEDWPVLRQKDQKQTHAMLTAMDIHPPLLRLEDPSLHTVTECKLTQGLNCKSRAVMAANRAEWIVTETDGYLWVAPPRSSRFLTHNYGSANQTQPATLYRFPLSSNLVEAVKVNAHLGSRFAFEAREDNILALVAPQKSEPMTESVKSELALLDLTLSKFSQRPVSISPSDFIPLPGESRYQMNVRFTNDHLVYAVSDLDEDDLAYVMDLDTRLPPTRLSVPHSVDRLDRVGANAVLIGEGEDYLGLSWIDLAAAPNLTDTLNLTNRFESEGRAQALNMRINENGSALLGLPTYLDDEDSESWGYDENDGTDISFARVSSFGQLADFGSVKGDPSRISPNYNCETSCVDWYGNARPFFIGDRVFALIGSELIELEETQGGLFERARVNLTAPL